MISLRRHRGWMALTGFSLVLLCGSGPALHFARGEIEHSRTEIGQARRAAEQILRQLRDNVATARKLAGQIDSRQADQILARVDRLKSAAFFEKEAAAFGLKEFTYTLSPESTVMHNSGGEAQELALSRLELAGDAADDIHVYRYIDHIRARLPGRLRITGLTLGRLPVALSPASNVHFQATLEWLSNGSLQTFAGVP
ncbi:MAG: hypothetical protein AB7H77_04200 [Bdellovibrionales bacterium]